MSEDEQRRSETVWPTAREAALDAMARLHGVIDLASHGRAMLRLLAARARISLTNTQADAILDRLRALGFTVVPFRRLARVISRLVGAGPSQASPASG